MLSFAPSVRVFLASEPVDMRRGHDGLFAIVKSWAKDPFSGDLYCFVGKRRDRVKVLVWHRGGFVLLYKRLEQGRFRIPRVPAGYPCSSTMTSSFVCSSMSRIAQLKKSRTLRATSRTTR